MSLQNKPIRIKASDPPLHLFSGPDAAHEVVPQPAEALVPPPDLAVRLQPPNQLLYRGQAAPTQTRNLRHQNLQLLLMDLQV